MKKGLVLVLVAAFCWAGSAIAGEGHGGGVHWGYSGGTGPIYWGSLSPDFKLCAEGKSQSPINLTGMVAGNLPAVKYDYGKSSLMIVNNGHTIQVNYDEGGDIWIGRDRYHFLQFHFHSPSENQINGVSFPLEAHLVHANDKGELAVISVMFHPGPANPLIDRILRYTPTLVPSTMSVSTASIKVTDLLPENRDYYTYSGSLTTPPCSEGVRWLVLKQPASASAEQIARFRSFFDDHNTNRPVQPLNGRNVYQ